jgi:hypothetical protein
LNIRQSSQTDVITTTVALRSCTGDLATGSRVLRTAIQLSELLWSKIDPSRDCNDRPLELELYDKEDGSVHGHASPW